MDKHITDNARRLNMNQRRNKRRTTPTGPPQATVHMHLNVHLQTDDFPIEVTEAYQAIGRVDNKEAVKQRLAEDHHQAFEECYEISKTVEEVIINFLRIGIRPSKGDEIHTEHGDWQAKEIHFTHYPGKIPTITVTVTDDDML